MFDEKSLDLYPLTKSLIKKFNFKYRVIDNEEYQKLILSILKRIDSDTQKIASNSRKKVWFKGWSENLDKFKKTKNLNKSLVPKFVRPNQPIRIFSKYCKTNNKNFELDYIQVYRTWFFEKYFKKLEHIHEFGCGTGFNLMSFINNYPEKEYHGSDFVYSSVNLVNYVSKYKNMNLSGYLFDMKRPNFKYDIKKNSGVFTFGSIEQLSGDYKNFIKFLIKKSPEIIVHTEPCEELYDLDNLNDYLAFKFQNKRGYSSGFINYLLELESKKKIKILKINRLFFGSLFMEGYNHISWKPL